MVDQMMIAAEEPSNLKHVGEDHSVVVLNTEKYSQ